MSNRKRENSIDDIGRENDGENGVKRLKFSNGDGENADSASSVSSILLTNNRHYAQQKKKKLNITPDMLIRMQAARAKAGVSAGSTSASVTSAIPSSTTSEKSSKGMLSPSLSFETAAGTVESSEERGGGGLKDIAIHPLLMSKTLSRPATPEAPIVNPVLATRRHRKGFDVNPYLSQEDMFSKNVPTRPRRDLKFNEKGKYINKAIELREAEKLAHEEELRSQEIRKMGLEPDISIGENLYRAVQPPNVEWWDKPLLKENSYDQIENVSKLTYMEISEDNPITHYIQFPVPINLSSGQMNAIIEPKIYLTKKELKKKRKIDRQTKLKREQELIRAGLLPPPPPKVKLKNLMSVLTNEAIKDPTAVEQKVKAEIEQRRLIHEKDNLERKLSKKSTTDKTQIRQENDLNKFGIFSNIFKIDHLVNSKHFYKLNVNAAQLNLKGVIIRLRERENFALVIIEGTLKNVEHYQKLMLRRINWKENVISKVKQIEQLNKDQVQEDIDLSKNKCSLIWEGQIKEFHFNKWSVPSIDTESDAINYLSRFNLDTYWRIAEAITDDDDD